MRRLFFCVSLLAFLALASLADDARQIVVEGVNAPDTGRNLRLIPPTGHTQFVNSAVLSSDGRLVLSGSSDSTLRLWDAASGREIRSFLGHSGEVEAVAFSPDGSRAASSSHDKTVRLWDVASGRLLHTFAQKGGGSFLQFAPDGRTLYAQDYKAILAYDMAAMSVGLQFNVTSSVDAAALSGDGRILLIGDNSGTLHIMDTQTKQETHNLTGLMDAGFNVFKAFAVSRDGKFGALSDSAKTLHLVDLNAGRELWKQTLKNNPGALAISPDNHFIVTQITYENSQRFDLATGKVVDENYLKMPYQSFSDFHYSPDGTRLLASMLSKKIGLFDADSGQPLQLFQGALDEKTLVFPPKSSSNVPECVRLDRNAPDKGAEVVDLTNGRVLRVLSGLPADVINTKFSSRGTWFWASNRKDYRVWNYATGERVASFTLDRQLLSGNLSDDATRFSAIDEKELHVYNAKTGAELFHVPVGDLFASGVKWSPDGSLLAHKDSTKVIVRDSQSGAEVARFTGHTSIIGDFEWSPDSTRIATGSGDPFYADKDDDSTIRIWEARSGRELLKMSGMTGLIDELLWSDDGETLASGGYDRTIRLWNPTTGALIGTGKGHTAIINHLSWTRDGKELISSGGDGTVRVWQTAPGVDPKRELWAFLMLQNDDWLTYTPDGRFDGSPGGLKKVHFARGLETFDLEQFAQAFLQPNLALVALNGELPPAAPAASIQSVVAQGAPPIVRIVSPEAGAGQAEKIEVTVQAQAQNGGGVKAIRLYQNGRLVGGPGELRGIVIEAAPQVAGEITTQKFPVMLQPGANVFRAVAYSQTELESRPAQVQVDFAAPEPARPTLWVLAVGINSYRDATMDLAYARPDAEAIADFFTKNEAPDTLFSSAKVTKLVDEAATGEAIQAAIAQIGAQSRPQDVVFLYLAGHGETAPLKEGDEAETFFFLPTDARQMAMKERVRQFGLSKPVIQALIGKIQARKIVLVYDACKSGAAITGATRGAAEEAQALMLLARAQGIHILTASNAQQYAGEVKALGHGILTYALLEGLAGKASAGGFVKISGLLDYVENRVPALSKEYRHAEQWPLRSTTGSNFPLVKSAE